MRKITLLLIALTVLAFSSCKKSEEDNLKPVTIAVSVQLDASVSAYNFGLKGTAIKLTNLTNGQVTNGQTDATGNISIPSISPGNYDVQATLTVLAADYSAATGTSTTNDITFSALIKSLSITESSTTVPLILKTGRIGDWIIKQIYYAGSNTSNGATFRDQFIELYNNSNEVLYADSLYFSQAYGANSKSSAIDLSKGYYQTSTKQYDWTKSIGMSNDQANTNYVYAKSLFMISGSGKEHPVQPGSSIIIAATALNHKSPFTGADGKTISVKDPSLTVDLSGADFEVYLGDYPGVNPLASDIDNPSVPNLKVIATGGARDLIMDATGRDAYFIFKTSEDVSTWKKYPAPDQTSISTSTDLYIQIPISYISDGVEIQTPLPANVVPKKFGSTIDVGSAFVSKGQYSSQSLIRKTSKTVNGRIVLTDTNNSANDFTELDIPDVTKTVFK